MVGVNIEEIDVDSALATEMIENSERVLAHISTDKPIYKPDDVMFVEVHVVNPVSKEPARLFQESWGSGVYNPETY